jgi:hypothetical protein
MFTKKEESYRDAILGRLTTLRAYLLSDSLEISSDLKSWYAYFARIKDIQGNINNDISFLANLLAKEYLSERFDIGNYDAAAKPQGAPGLDIELVADGKTIIAEIKTTYPYGITDFGAQQKKSFERDFEKLNNKEADHKFLFVTEQKTFDILCGNKYAEKSQNITVVNLITNAGKLV